MECTGARGSVVSSEGDGGVPVCVWLLGLGGGVLSWLSGG